MGGVNLPRGFESLPLRLSMADRPTEHRFYGELGVWWPLISPPEEYVEEAAYAATVLGSASIPVREILELGSGGGHSAVHLKARFAMTLVDPSEQMLAVSRRLNPECEHLQAITVGATVSRVARCATRADLIRTPPTRGP